MFIIDVYFIHIKHTKGKWVLSIEFIISELNLMQTQWREVRDPGVVFILSGFTISDPDCNYNKSAL